MRLFTALVPPAEAAAALRDTLRDVPSGPGLRWVTPEQWHVTLGFYGEDDAEARAAWLRTRLAGLGAPRVRLAGAGSFRGVLWVGVDGDDLGELATAAGANQQDDREFHPHLTLARGRPKGGLAGFVSRLERHSGPGWLAGEVVLLRSDQGPGGVRYTAVERYPLSTSRSHPEPG